MSCFCKKSSQNSDGNAPGSSKIRLHQASMLAPSLSRPKSIMTIDCRCVGAAGVDNDEGHLKTNTIPPGAAWGHSSPLVQWFLLPPPPLPTRRWRHSLFSDFSAFARPYVTLLPGSRGSTRRPRAATGAPPKWRHADDVLSCLVASVALWVGPPSRAGAPLLYSVSQHVTALDRRNPRASLRSVVL